MTYYEELGLSPAASTEDIRKAYKRLARLLHPDKLQDKPARQVAECQMRRLNGVYETLSDAGKRVAYDISLQPPPPQSPLAPVSDEDAVPQAWTWKDLWAWLRGPNGVWVVASAFAIFLLVYTLADGGRAPAAHHPADIGRSATPAVAPPATVADSGTPRRFAVRPVEDGERAIAQQVSQLQAQLHEVTQRHENAQLRIAQLEDQLREGHSTVPLRTEPFGKVAEPVPAPVASMPAPAAVPSPLDRKVSRPPGVAGAWFFSRSPNSRGGKDTYVAEYIEAVIREDGGALLGRYKARYKVTDRAISPDVSFEFRGRSDAPRLPWAGPGNSKGEVRLRLLSENALEISWLASDLGSMGLGSGTAVLVRRLDRQ